MWYQNSVFDATEKCDLGGLVYYFFMVLLERRFQTSFLKSNKERINIAKIGYARVSTKEQSENPHVDQSGGFVYPFI
ncbi:hypothetical protein EGM85_08655 [Macrococcus caseolyticus]|nr:hypothetical protein [Macrococcus caseolyticus]RKO13981.1 hypothetical protein D6861_08655 [Macrococcus caseolyticus]